MAPEAETIEVPRDDWWRMVAREGGREGAKEVIKQHMESCPTHGLHDTLVSDHAKLDRLNVKLAYLIGLLVGSGVLGGVAGAALTKLM